MKTKPVFLSIFFLCAFLCCPPGSAFAKEAKDEPAYKLGEIVVSGEMTDIDDTAISDTITAEEIKATNSRTVAEALKFAPGVVITRGRKNEPEISVHGFSQEKTLFLIDGIPYYETYYGKLNLDQIPTEMISKIEVTKNAPSVLYGPNAQIAVVNIVTKQGSAAPSFNFRADVGEYDTFSTSVSHGNQIGNINYWLSFMHRESDGWRMSHDFNPEIARRVKKKMPDRDGIHEDGGFRENSDYNKNRFWARVGLTPSANSEYFITFHSIQSDYGNPPATNEYRLKPKGEIFSTLSRFDKYDDWGIDFSGRHDFSEDFTLRGKLFYHDHVDEYESYDSAAYDKILAVSKWEDDIIGGNLITDFSLADWHKGHVSAHYRSDHHRARGADDLPFNESDSHVGSVGTEQEWISGFGLSVFAGVSCDWFRVSEAEDYKTDKRKNIVGQKDMDTEDAAEEVNPMIGFNWTAEKTEFYGSVAKKTRFPTLYQLYSSHGGNPDLDAEESINYTLGFRHNFCTWLSFELAGFYHDIDDYISKDYYEDDYTGIMLYENMAEIAMRGVETSLRLRPCDYFRLNLDYTYNNAKNESDNRVTSRVIGVPEHKYGVGCDITIPGILARLNLRGIFVDKMYGELPTPEQPNAEAVETDDYFILNTRLSTQKYYNMISVYAEVDNIFDYNYEQELGFPGRGRNFRVGVEAKF